jgi:hypothetical protein
MILAVAASNLAATPQAWPTWVFNVIFPINRWIHLVASTLIVGGLLFFEFVVPLATADLGQEHQHAVFGRARWVFRRVVWISFFALILSGAFSTWRMWFIYTTDERIIGDRFWLGSRPWVYLHIALGFLGLLMALRVTSTRRVQSHPVGWMRAILVILLASMFIVSVARQVRLRIREWQEMQHMPADQHSNMPAV